MKMLVKNLRLILRDEEAATVVEYGLLVALLVLSIFTAISALGNPTQANYENIVNMWPDP
ncbi:MAG: Flp family type IVb pilin [Pseudomonadota bacterium]